MTINCSGELIDLTIPRVMGILNCTPNSFFDGGRFADEKSILKKTEKMLLDGATFIDIGGYSTKPNAEFVSQEEELQRTVPVVELILKHFPKTIISIDTFRSEVAKNCIEKGASIINDISSGTADEKMLEVVATYNVPYIMMHSRGNPQTMQELTDYENIIKDLLFFFSEKIALARNLGINDIIIDPGFGFAKTLSQNFEVLDKLDSFRIIELPILAGISRKSMIYKTINTTPDDALNGTTVLNTIAMSKGANILRVHDVKEASECITLYNQTKKICVL